MIHESTPAPPEANSDLGTGRARRRQRNLAKFIGPLARVVVNRAARKAENLNELYTLLSAEIKSEKDRAEFLALGARRSDWTTRLG